MHSTLSDEHKKGRKMSLRRQRSLLFTIAFFSLLFACSTQFAGPVTDEGNPQIIASIVDRNNLPVAHAEVSVYRMGDATDSSIAITATVLVAQSSTNSDGECSFENLVDGRYSIKARDSVEKGAGIRSNVIIRSDTNSTQRDTITLSQTGEITGVVSRGGLQGTNINSQLHDAFIQVKLRELAADYLTDTDGKYRFVNIPAGTYTVLYYASNDFFTAKRENVLVASSNVTDIDTVVLRAKPVLVPPAVFLARYDTANGIVRLGWSIVVYSDMRWYEVERIDPNGSYSRLWHTTDTVSVDTVATLPRKTTVYYIVRTVDNAFNISRNSNAIEITTF
jgi:hypothetical protein